MQSSLSPYLASFFFFSFFLFCVNHERCSVSGVAFFFLFISFSLFLV